MKATTLAELEPDTLAQILFACPIQPSEHPSPATIRTAVSTQFLRCRKDLTACLGAVAQEAGDHPEVYAARMRWAIQSIALAYTRRLACPHPVPQAA